MISGDITVTAGEVGDSFGASGGWSWCLYRRCDKASWPGSP